jgi:hypothetical protein
MNILEGCFDLESLGNFPYLFILLFFFHMQILGYTSFHGVVWSSVAA